MPIRLHDMRAVFVTVSLANGKTEKWVTDRTGHKSSQMLETYSRQARTWEELGLGTLEPLDELLPELEGPQTGPAEAQGESGVLPELPTGEGVPMGSEWAAESSPGDRFL
jgi:hypothetical protein